MSVLDVLLAALAAWTLALALYLAVLTGAAFRARAAPAPPAGARWRRFVVCVPAHNEESRLRRLLASIRDQDYPNGRLAVHVVADNCTDATAAVARAGGATVHERVNERLVGKEFALRWLLSRIRESNEQFDGYVFVDADSALDPSFFARMDARLDSGAQVIQACYAVVDPGSSPLASVRSAALATIHYVRPLGRSVLGLSAGLKGNGMCFSAALMERIGWHWFTLAEAAEVHLALIEQGVPVKFAPETRVLGEMPPTLSRAYTRNARWKVGRLHAVRKDVPRLIADGIRLRDPLRLDAAAEQLIPPLFVPLFVAPVVAAFGAALGQTVTAWVALISAVGLAGHVVVSMVLTRAPARAYAELLLVPPYVAWKVGLYLRSLLLAREIRWLRTPRP